MNYLNISYPDLNNGEGCRVTLWISGCPHHCIGCHNPESWNYDVGHLYTEETEKKILNICKLPYIKGLTLSGGEPLQESNISNLISLCDKVHALHKDIWCYTGYYFEQLSPKLKVFVTNYIDVLVDGPFIKELKDTSSNNPFKGSTNQSLIYIPTDYYKKFGKL